MGVDLDSFAWMQLKAQPILANMNISNSTKLEYNEGQRTCWWCSPSSINVTWRFDLCRQVEIAMGTLLQTMCPILTLLGMVLSQAQEGFKGAPIVLVMVLYNSGWYLMDLLNWIFCNYLDVLFKVFVDRLYEYRNDWKYLEGQDVVQDKFD